MDNSEDNDKEQEKPDVKKKFTSLLKGKGSSATSSSAKRELPYTSHVQRLWARLLEEEKELMIEKAKVRDVWLMIMDARKKNEEDRKSLNHEGLLEFVEPHSRITLNVGGQLFESTCEVLTRDRFSLLASLCRADPAKVPLKPNKQGHFFIDRDWWIFRHVLHFLRDGAIPDDPPLLQELYSESIFYQLQSLRKAVETRLQGRVAYDDMGRRGQFLDLLLHTSTSTHAHGRSTRRPVESSPSPPRRHSGKDAGPRGVLPDPYGFIR